MLRQQGIAAPYTLAECGRDFRELQGPRRLLDGLRGARPRSHRQQERNGAKPNSVLAYGDPQWRGRAVMANPLFGTTTTEIAALFVLWGDERAAGVHERAQSQWHQALAQQRRQRRSGRPRRICLQPGRHGRRGEPHAPASAGGACLSRSRRRRHRLLPRAQRRGADRRRAAPRHGAKAHRLSALQGCGSQASPLRRRTNPAPSRRRRPARAAAHRQAEDDASELR